MIVHIALFKWKEDVAKNTVELMMDEIRVLKNKVDGVVDILCGENFSVWSGGYTHAVVVLAKDRAGLEAYRNHPDHQDIVKNIEKMEAVSIGIDFET